MISLKYYYEQIVGGWNVAGYDVGTYAIATLPNLIWCAQNRSIMTYTMMAQDANLPQYFFIPANFFPFSNMTGLMAGLIGNYCSYLDLPPLNALIVRADTHIPGGGIDFFLRSFGINNYKDLTTRQKRQELNNSIYPLIFRNDIWDSLLEANGVQANEPNEYIPYVQVQNPENGNDDNVDNNNQGGNRRGGERNPHRLLKEYVIMNCQNIPELRERGCHSENADDEFIFPSLDRADIFFNNEEVDDEQFNIACEIKSYCSNDDDIKRGIFQCVKYRALLNAENELNGRRRRSRCFLIVQRILPDELNEIAETLNVPCIVLSPEDVGN